MDSQPPEQPTTSLQPALTSGLQARSEASEPNPTRLVNEGAKP
jgi:hypothetical protein